MNAHRKYLSLINTFISSWKKPWGVPWDWLEIQDKTFYEEILKKDIKECLPTEIKDEIEDRKRDYCYM